MTMLASIGAAALPSGPAYTVVLLCHVAAVLVGMVTMLAGAVFALRLLAAGARPVPASVRSYFSPGTNWAGRVLYLVPVFGLALLAMSGGAYRPSSDWVLVGIGLWVVAIAVAEAAVWPSEQRVRRALAATATGAAATPTVTSGPTATRTVTAPAPAEARRAARTMCVSSAAVLAVLIAATVVMVAKP
jgi:uncharacterized membrane protein